MAFTTWCTPEAGSMSVPSQLQGKLTDDRPPGEPLNIDELNYAAGKLLDRFPNPVEAVTRHKT